MAGRCINQNPNPWRNRMNLLKIISGFFSNKKESSLEWSHTLLDGKRVDYATAEAAIKALGPDWRMPTFDELFSLVDRTRYNPAIDIIKFPDTKSTWYWSSTPTSWNNLGRGLRRRLCQRLSSRLRRLCAGGARSRRSVTFAF